MQRAEATAWDEILPENTASKMPQILALLPSPRLPCYGVHSCPQQWTEQPPTQPFYFLPAGVILVISLRILTLGLNCHIALSLNKTVTFLKG